MKHLEISLIKFNDFAKTLLVEKKWDDSHSDIFEEIAKGREKLEDEDYAQLRRNVSVLSGAMGLSDKGEDYKNKEFIELESTVHPSHPFRVGTLFDTMDEFALSVVLGNMGIPTLHDIFSDQQEYVDDGGGIEYVRPDWPVCLDTVFDAVRMLKERMNSGEDLMVSTVSLPASMVGVCPTGPSSAIEHYKKELQYARAKGIDKNYHNSAGWYFTHKALSIRAAIPGTKTIDGASVPVTYLVYNVNMEWYLNALLIVRETIEYVLSQPEGEHDKYWLRFNTETLR